jgi:hypothetical protein
MSALLPLGRPAHGSAALCGQGCDCANHLQAYVERYEHSLKQIDVGLLDVGYAEAAPMHEKYKDSSQTLDFDEV